MPRSRLGLISAVLVLSLVLSACGAAPAQQPKAQEPAAKPQAAPAPKSLNVYTSVPEDLINEIAARFAKKAPDLPVKVYRAGTTEVLAKIEAEAKAGAILADVVWVAETTATEDLKERNLLRTYSSPEAAKIPESLKDAGGFYYGSRLINMVLAYNTKTFKTAPTSWKDFLSTAYKAKVGFPTPAASGSALYAVGSMVDSKDFGWKYFEDVRKNGGVQLKNNADAVQKVATGELVMAMALDYQVKNLKDKGSPIDYVVPKEGLVMVVSPIALLKGSPNQKGGEVFVDYVLSQECQKFMSESQSVVPVRTDVVPPAGIPTLEKLKAMKSDPSFIKKNKSQIIDKFTEIFTK